MEKSFSFPVEIQDLEHEKTIEVTKYFKGLQNSFVQVGPEKYFFCADYKREGPKIYNMEIRSTDIFVVTVPKSGTTWTQELIWLLENHFDYETAMAVPLTQRFPFLDLSMTVNSKYATSQVNAINDGSEKQRQITKMLSMSVLEVLGKSRSPRFIKSHLPLSLLPPSLLASATVVYVARDPRDVAVSYYHHARLMLMIGFEEDFKIFWNFFRNSLVNWTPYFSHVKEAWAMRNHPNMLFLFYEELCEDLQAGVRRVANFLNKPVTELQVARLCEHLTFENFRKNASVNYEELREYGVLREGHSFMRKGFVGYLHDATKVALSMLVSALLNLGKAGGWRDYFDEEMAAQAQQWIDHNLRGTDLRFPDVDN